MGNATTRGPLPGATELTLAWQRQHEVVLRDSRDGSRFRARWRQLATHWLGTAAAPATVAATRAHLRGH